MYIVLLAMLALNVSSDVLNGFALVEESLRRTTGNVMKENQRVFTDFEEQLRANPAKVKAWFDKARQVKDMSDSLYRFAEELKLAIAREADGDDADPTNLEHRDDVEAADIVITGNGGHPLDQNLYQSPKAASTAAAFAGEDGVIILCCSCSDGVGGTHFQELMQSGTPEQIDARLAAILADQTIPEQWCAQIYARILRRHRLILVSDGLDPDLVARLNMTPAPTLADALALARRLKGPDARIIVIPDGVNVVPAS